MRLQELGHNLSQLYNSLRGWLDSPPRFPRRPEIRNALRDLLGQVEQARSDLQRENPVLWVMLLGGTGVGKSTLLNAIAGRNIAAASLERPTTKRPAVYCHPHHVLARDVGLRLGTDCDIIFHDRPELAQKVLIDTPDIDSTVTKHRELLEAMLPAADVVLYVGSQEKYHDRAALELLRKHSTQRAFAFVLNKWDRCQQDSGSGTSPDQDLLRDLESLGYPRPLLFRTCARAWVRPSEGPTVLPPGEEFGHLNAWLEAQLGLKEIEVIKRRGVLLLLKQIEKLLDEGLPPDPENEVGALKEAWQAEMHSLVERIWDLLQKVARSRAGMIEAQARNALYRHFGGILGMVLRLSNFRFAELKRLVSWPVGRPQADDPAKSLPGRDSANKADDYRLLSVEHDNVSRIISSYLTGFVDGLRVASDQCSLGPILRSKLDNAIPRDFSNWAVSAYLLALQKTVTDVVLADPRIRPIAAVLGWSGVYLPALALAVGIVYALMDFFAQGDGRFGSLWEAMLFPILLCALVVVVLYLLVRILLPVRWSRIEYLLAECLKQDLNDRLKGLLWPILEATGKEVKEERDRMLQLLREFRDLREDLERWQQDTDVHGVGGMWADLGTRPG